MKQKQFLIDDEIEEEAIDYIFDSNEPILNKNSFDLMSLNVTLGRMKIENSFLKRENSILKEDLKYLRENVSEKMDEQSARLEKVMKFQTQIPKIYYIGIPFGILGIIFGALNDNLLYFIGGAGISLTAIVGILEFRWVKS